MAGIEPGGSVEPTRSFLTAVNGPAGLGFTFALIPSSAFPDQVVPSAAALAGVLEMSILGTFEHAIELPGIVAGMLAGPNAAGFLGAPFALSTWTDRFGTAEDSNRIFGFDLFGFAEYLSFADLLVIEESPIRKIALATVKVVVRGIEVGGAAVGIAVVAGVSGPVLIVAGAGAAVLGVVATDETREDVARLAHKIMRRQ